jgi:hypothetical protein
MHTQIYIYQYVRHDLREEIIYDLWFLNDDDRMEMTISLTKFDDPQRASDEEVDEL